MVVVSLYQDSPSSESYLQRFLTDNTLARLEALDARIQRKGLASLDPSRNRLIPIGTEIDAKGSVTKNGYGVLNLPWRAKAAGDWAERVRKEAEEIRAAIKSAHGVRLRFVIWAGMGGSAEDKTMLNAVGLLKGGPRLYVLDSTDPAKLKHILADMQKRARCPLKDALKSTLVVGMAMGMTSYEPVVNLEKIYNLFEKYKLDSRSNFIYMTLPGSLLDQFASSRGYRRVDLQLDGGNSTAGRHSAPLTRGCLYPLALAGSDLDEWIAGTQLTADQVQEAWKLAAFLEAQGRAGRDKVTLMLPKAWEGAGLWTKQDFEESLGKSEQIGIKIVIGETPRLANYRSPKEPHQDRVFLVVQRKGEAVDARKVQLLRRSGYPLATVTLPAKAPLSTYMQFVHYVVFGLGFLRDMNFVTQPSVELYKAITNRLYAEAQKAGGIRQTAAWKRFAAPAATVRYRAGLTLHTSFVPKPGETTANAAALYAHLLGQAAHQRSVEQGELTFFGDARYSGDGRALRKRLDRAAEQVFRSRLKMPVDVYEGPAMNHSYHEMIIGHGKCFTTVLMVDKQESIPDAGYDAEYHTAQFLATQMALAERGRHVVAILVKDLEASSLSALDEFFRQVAGLLKNGRRK